jgi:endonuclease/exonuclease/phosphatase (EEP) superfamily protein YafD
VRVILASSLSTAVVAIGISIVSLHFVLDIFEGKVTEAVRLVTITAKGWRAEV